MVIIMIYYNPNPKGLRVDDCAIRALSKALNKSWDDAFIAVTLEAYSMCNMPSGNSVWGNVLRQNGYTLRTVDDMCTVSEFCAAHDKGRYVLALNSHVVYAENGEYYDSWDSGDELIIYYWEDVNNGL